MTIILKTVLFFSLLVSAQSTNKIVQGTVFPGAYLKPNYILNDSCIWGTSNITQSTASTLTRGISSPIDETSNCVIDATGSSQTWDFLAQTLPGGFSSGTCQASFIYLGDASLYQAVARINGSDVSGTTFTLTNASVPTTFQMSYTCSTTLSNQAIRIQSTSASGAAFKIALVSLSKKETPWFISTTITGANPDLGTSGQSAYIGIEDTGLTMTPATGSQPTGIMCSGTNAAATPTTSTSTCSVGSESVSVNFYIQDIGAYEFCFDYSHAIVLDQTEQVTSYFQIYETPTNAQTLTLAGGSVQASGGMTGSTTGNDQLSVDDHHNCSVFYWSSPGLKGLRLMYQQTVNGTPDSNVIFGDAGGSGTGNRRINILGKKL